MPDDASRARSTSARYTLLQTKVAVWLAAIMLVLAMLSLRLFIGGKLLPLRSAHRAVGLEPSASVELVSGTVDSLRLKPDAAQRLGVKTAKARLANLADSLQLSGTLTLDAGQLEQVRCRFAGEIVEIGTNAETSRAVQFGDRVAKGQLLAVVWSRELGEKKSELIDALSQSHLDSQTLQRLEGLYRDGAIPEREFREAERAVESDRITVARILRTLQTWRVTDDEIAVVEAEAQKLIEGGTRTSNEVIDRWARVEVRAALDGVVLERNAAVGDIVSPEDELFKVGDLSRFRVLAYAYEEDLPRLDLLQPDQRRWAITAPARADVPPQLGMIEQVGHIIDPAQHTALVMGWIDDPDGRLRAGQFIAAAISLPPPGNEVVLPATAVIEKGGEQLVFVKTSHDPIFQQRRVSVSRQVGNNTCLHIEPPPTTEPPAPLGLKPDEEVVTSGAVELQQALTDLLASQAETAAQGE